MSTSEKFEGFAYTAGQNKLYALQSLLMTMAAVLEEHFEEFEDCFTEELDELKGHCSGIELILVEEALAALEAP